MAVLTLMVGIAEYSGEKEIIFPEMAALTIGLWISNKLNKIFEPLYRLDESRNYEIAGSGMGLYIIKILLESKGMKYSFLPCDGGMEFKIEIDEEK